MPTLISKNKMIGVTLGDSAGIGPEVVAKALSQLSIRQLAHFVIIGDDRLFRQYFSPLCFRQLSFVHSKCPTLPLRQNSQHLNLRTAQSALTYLNKAVELLKTKEIDALVTAPVCKESINKIYPKFRGHTEFLAEAFNVKNYGMMFVAKKFCTMLVTRHIPLKDVSRTINVKIIAEAIDLTNQTLKNYFKIKNPLIAVCGLNPHASEGGTIGNEEMRKIIPAIRDAISRNISIEGPFAADTLFTPIVLKKYHAVIAMYHDQGLIPLKTLYFTKLVNLTVGLPFVRTSPAHGTAFSIAGKNIADASSMIEAIKLAAYLINQ